MNRRGFLRAVGATGLWLWILGPALWAAARKKTVEERLREALAERREVQFKYHGYARCVEPHALGRATENRPAVLGWQVSGGSASEPPPGWRTFVLEEISALKLMRKKFAPRPDYHPEKTKLKLIEVEIASDRKLAMK
ncbi:WYL domain-containing protein [Opitutus sp. GAS368]|jgi:hypothetical protein|uniref:twin-arginine translocation signal domain-containing protein n=1 Tax=Opitutus sp. GAS368 TaxID=1882749 RepID=UPI00087ABBC8|nr:WYL domain-containing protein [Opitutus sp. GAS368]SDR97286.1 Tat (twin-arginine translocation) pathway signal sequence [Opitutus sp. GAS368]